MYVPGTRLGAVGEPTPLSLQTGAQNGSTKDSLTKIKTVFILSMHISSKFWRLEVQKASDHQCFLVWGF